MIKVQETEKTKRPVCKEKRYNLPRHMRLIHHWSDTGATNVKNLYG